LKTPDLQGLTPFQTSFDGPLPLSRELYLEVEVMPRGFSLLLTGTQAADRLGVSVQCVLRWAAEGRLPIAGQDEDGRALFREHVIETIGADLIARADTTMSFYKVTVTLPRTAELTVCARDEQTARQAAWEFISTAFANALRFWGDNEPISDDEGQLLGEAQLDMPDEGVIELAQDAVEITGRQESRQ
jgi:hypothetical protein